MFNASSSFTTNSSDILLNFGNDPSNTLNLSTSVFFDQPPPPGGPGAGFSPLFNRPGFDIIIPYQIIDLGFSQRFEAIGTIFNALGNLLSPKAQSVPMQDFCTSKADSPLSSKHTFSNLLGFDEANIPETILQCYMFHSNSEPTNEERIHDAVCTGNVEQLRGLLETIAPAEFYQQDNEGMTPAHYAAAIGEVEVLKFLATIDVQAIRQRDSEGDTPAHHAAGAGQIEVLRFFATIPGVNLNQPNNAGSTPLHSAATTGETNVFKFLVTINNVDLDQTDNKGWTPAHHAAVQGYVDILIFLASKNADLNLSDEDGDTPAHYAALEGQIEVLYYLRTIKRVNLQQINYKGLTPADFAKAAKHTDAFNFLEALPNEKEETT